VPTNERTSPKAASNAGSALSLTDEELLHLATSDPEAFLRAIAKLRSAAGSALTQAPDRTK
jgi:hypothetical protein